MRTHSAGSEAAEESLKCAIAVARELGIARHEQIAAEVVSASKPDAPTTSGENETAALSSETPGQ